MSGSVLINSLETRLKLVNGLAAKAQWAHRCQTDPTTRYARQLSALVDAHTSAAAVYSDAIEKAKEKGL